MGGRWQWVRNFYAPSSHGPQVNSSGWGCLSQLIDAFLFHGLMASADRLSALLIPLYTHSLSPRFAYSSRLVACFETKFESSLRLGRAAPPNTPVLRGWENDCPHRKCSEGPCPLSGLSAFWALFVQFLPFPSSR